MKLPFSFKDHKIKIGKTYVGEGCPTFFIAEIGLNHNGKVAMAKELISEAKRAGAQAVKFQKRNMKEIFTSESLTKPYKSAHAYGETYGEHREALEFGLEDYEELFRYAKELNILMFASVWDIESFKFMEQFSVDAYKIASADMNYYELIKVVSESNKPILISTGMGTEDQIKKVITFTRKYTSKYIFMHCTSVYPAEDQEINLSFMRKIQKWSLGNPVGYSGHETDSLPSLISTIKGAKVIERHLTLDKNAKGSDHAASLTPIEFAELIATTKRLSTILGNGIKKDLSQKLFESKNKLSKSLYTNKVISKGSRITIDDLVVKSPGGGLEPNQVKLILGKKVRNEMSEEHQISLNDFE